MSKKSKAVILVTNDDGITAPGLHALVEAVKHLGEIIVVAPDSCVYRTLAGLSALSRKVASGSHARCTAGLTS